MSESERTMIDKSESSSFEDLASAAAHEIEEAKLAEAAATAEKKEPEEASPKPEWQDVLGSGALLKKVNKLVNLIDCFLSFCSISCLNYII